VTERRLGWSAVFTAHDSKGSTRGQLVGRTVEGQVTNFSGTKQKFASALGAFQQGVQRLRGEAASLCLSTHFIEHACK
jgi:hypothetical protein